MQILSKVQQCLCDLNDENEKVSSLDDSDIDLDSARTSSSSESDSADLDGEDSQSLSNVWDNISVHKHCKEPETCVRKSGLEWKSKLRNTLRETFLHNVI